MVQHLLEEQELPAVVMAHQHLMVAERLAQRMGGHLHGQVELVGDALQESVNRLHAQRLVDVAATVGLAAEHIVTQADVRRVLQIESHRFNDGVVDSDVAVLLALAGVARLLLEHGEAVAECAVVVNKIGEPKHPQVAGAESKVDADDEQHVVTIAPVGNKVLGDAEDIVQALDRLGSVLWSELAVRVLDSRGDESGNQFAGCAVSERVEVDDVVVEARGLHLDDRHMYRPFGMNLWLAPV